MEPTRLILVPQLPVAMRYQEWWHREFTEKLAPHFEDIKVLGTHTKSSYPLVVGREFSVTDFAIQNELDQVRQYMALGKEWGNAVLLHLDLSYPGIFHSVLAHKKPRRSVVFCHATAQNNMDIFEPIRKPKYAMEWGASQLYDKVLVATHYHAKKLAKHNMPTVVMGALPHPPKGHIYPGYVPFGRGLDFVSAARPTPQKVWKEVETQLIMLGRDVFRISAKDWWEYFAMLSRSHFLLCTGREETYGYQVVDAVLQGCIPIAPNDYAYPELLPSRLLYNQKQSPAEQALEIIHIAEEEAQRPQPVTLICEREAQNFWNRLVKELKE